MQLILLPFAETSKELAFELGHAARQNDVHTLEHYLQRPQDPNLQAVSVEAGLASGRLLWIVKQSSSHNETILM